MRTEPFSIMRKNEFLEKWNSAFVQSFEMTRRSTNSCWDLLKPMQLSKFDYHAKKKDVTDKHEAVMHEVLFPVHIEYID